ncbi:MAG: hypothetical protein ACKV22_06030 [Bryobacteraceae bacterium]
MDARISRRGLARLALTGVAAAQAQSSPAPRNAEEELALARRVLSAAASDLNKAKLMQATEPAFLFRP